MGYRRTYEKVRRHTVDAHSIPIPSNMYVAKSGKMPPKSDRMKVFAAIAEAANMRYASTM